MSSNFASGVTELNHPAWPSPDLKVDYEGLADLSNGPIGQRDRRKISAELLKADTSEVENDGLHSLVGEAMGAVTVKEDRTKALQVNHLIRDEEYATFEEVFDTAIQQTVESLDLDKASDLVSAQQIKDIDTAHMLLSTFRKNLIKHDSVRVDITGGNKSKAKHLDRREQFMFKLLLERKLGLDFSTSRNGETNTKYFKFTVPREKLAMVKGKERATTNS